MDAARATHPRTIEALGRLYRVLPDERTRALATEVVQHAVRETVSWCEARTLSAPRLASFLGAIIDRANRRVD